MARVSLSPAQFAQPRQLQLAGQTLYLDCGGVHISIWPDAAALQADVQALIDAVDPVVRYAGGALIADLCLQDNMMLEAALLDGVLPRKLLPEIDALFERAGYPVNWPAWALTFPSTASAIEAMQVRIGRALAADPDILLIDAAQWDDALLAPERFSRSFSIQYPWRTLVWAASSALRANTLAIPAGLQA